MYARLLIVSAILAGSCTTRAQSCTPPPSGLVGWWRAEGNALDAAGGNNGTLAGNAQYGVGKVGQGFRLDGNGSAVRLGNPVALQLQDFTMEAWICRSSVTAVSALTTDAAFLAGGSGSYSFGIHSDGRLFLGNIGVDAVTANTSVTDAAFHHVAVTKSGTTVTFYVDGVVYGAPALIYPFTFGSQVAIGARGDDLSGSFLGTIDEMSIYSRALTSAEIQTIYAAGVAGKCLGTPPLITVPPSPQSVPAGGLAQFSFQWSGTPPFTFQWSLNGSNLDGQTNAVLNLPNVQPAQAGSYAVLVRNAYGTALSAGATMTVLPALPCASPPSGLVSWWRGEGNTLDAVGGNDGTLKGNATYGPGQIGSGFVLDGQGSAVQVANSASFQLQNFTIETWMRRSSTSGVGYSGTDAALFGCGGGGYVFGINSLGRLFLGNVGVSAIYAGTSITDTNFHHVAVTKSGTAVVFYVDGVAGGVITYSTTFNVVGPVAIGARGDNLSGGFLGVLDEMSIYSRALTASEILALAQANISGKCASAPVIVSGPASRVVIVGQSATFTVSASGSRPISFQWTFNGSNIDGATNAVLALTNLQLNQAGQYAVLVSNSAGSQMSDAATLAVNPVPPCLPAPSGLVGWWTGDGNALDSVGTNNGILTGSVSFVTGLRNQAFLLSATRSGILLNNSASLQLQDFTIEGWVSRSSVTSVSAAGGDAMLFGYGTGGYNFAMNTSGALYLAQAGSATSSVGPSVTDTQFHHVAVTKSGSNVTFYLDGAASAAAPLTNVFVFTTTPAIGVSGNGLSGSFLGMIDEWSVYNRALSLAEIQSIFGANLSGKCPLAPTIVLQPQGQQVYVGNSVSFTAAGAGTPPLQYQWTFDGTNLDGATNSMLVLSNVTADQAGNYVVQVSSVYGSALSVAAVLNVSPPPPCMTAPQGLISWWRGEGNAWDSAGTNHGRPYGSLKYGAGFAGQAFVLDGYSEVVIPNPVSLQLQDFTIEAWVQRGNALQVSGYPGNDAVFFNYNYVFGVHADGTLFIAPEYSSGVASVGPRLQDTAFHHVAVTKSGSNVVFYVDGTGTAASPLDVTFGSADTIGILGGSGGYFGYNGFVGLIDELSIYSRSLDPSEVQAIYAANLSGKCLLPPSIALQPQNTQVIQHDTAVFSATAAGSPPFSYQWNFEGADLPGQTNSFLTLYNVDFNQAGNYAVRVSSDSGSVLSSNATLAVLPIPPCAPAPAGLIGWWQAEGNALDSVGTINGTLAGSATFGPGRVGQGFVLGGNGDAVQLGTAPSLQLQDFTIETWVRRSSPAYVSQNASDSDFFAFGGGGTAFGIHINGTLYLGSVGNSSVDATAGITDTNWHHIAVTKSGTSVVFYVDGIAGPTQTFGTTFSFGTTAAIGARGDDLSGSFAGTIDELSFYNRALTAAEVASVNGAGPSGKCAVPPQILAQPSSLTAFVGRTAFFGVVASGSHPLVYQWTLNGTNLDGATNATLSVGSVGYGQAGTYQVLVSNSGGSVLSSNAILVVEPPPPRVQPVLGLVSWWRGEGNALDTVGGNNGTLAGNATYGPGIVGQAFAFDGSGDAVVFGNPPSLQLQEFTIETWIQRASTTSVGGGTDGLFLGYGHIGPVFGIHSNGQIYLGCTDDSTLTSVAVVTDTIWHHVAVTKSGPFVTFYLDGIAYPAGTYAVTYSYTTTGAIGARGDNLSLGFLGAIDELSIYSRALTGAEIQAIYAADLSGKCYNTPPQIATQPASQAVHEGKSASFSVAAAGLGPFSYQWTFNGTNLDGATNATLVLNNVRLSQAGPYAALVSNPSGSVLSSNAILTVIPPPPCAPAPAGLVGWWRGEGNTLDSGGPNNGTLAGNAGYGPGMAGQGFVFDGYTDAVQLGAAPALQLQDFTIETWVQRSSASFVTQVGGDSDFFAFGWGGTAFGIHAFGALYLGTIGYSAIDATAGIADTNWHHIAVTKAGSSVVFYVDGIPGPVQSYNTTFSFGSSAAIGARGDNLAGSFAGTIDELSIYNRALTAAEIQSIYAAYSSGKCHDVPPVFTLQPTNQNAHVHDTVTMTVAVVGTQPFAYQWMFNGLDISYATNTSLVLVDVQLAQAGNYSVLVTNSFGSIISSNATLAVTAIQPTITTQPSSLSVLVGDSVLFTVTAAGTTPFSYQWRFNGVDLDGATNSSLALSNVQLNQAGAYSVRVSNDGGSILSSDAILTVTAVPPTISVQPASRTAIAGGSVQFGVTASGSLPLSYQWQFNGTPITGATGQSLLLTGLQTSQAGNYSVVITNVAGTVTSSTAVLTILTSGSCVTAPLGLVSWWPGQVDASDANGGNDGVLVGNAHVGPAVVGNGFVLDGDHDGVGVGKPANLQLQDFTIEAWIQRGRSIGVSQTGSDAALFGYGPGGYVLGIDYSGLLFLGNVGAFSVYSSVGVTDTAFHHVAVTKSGTTIVFYIDGVPYPAPAFSTQFTFTTSAAIGARGDNFSGSFLGTIDEMSIYNLPLNANEVEAIYAAGVFGKCSSIAPQIMTQPSDQAVDFAGSVTFSVLANGSPPLSYQWTFNGVAIDGATSSQLDLSNVQVSQAGVYAVVVTNMFGSVTSSDATLTVRAYPPVIVTQPSSVDVFVGQNASFQAAATGSPTLSYQWQFNGAPINGATGSALVLNNVQLAQAGEYSLVVTNAFGSDVSQSAVLTVRAVPECSPVPSGIVSWWSGENNTLDSFGGNTGTLAGAAGYAPGHVGQAFVFDGNSSAVRVGSPANLHLQDFTIEAWIRRGSATAIGSGLDAALLGYGMGGFVFGIHNGGSLFLGNVGTGAVYGGTLIKDTSFHHVAVTKAGPTVFFYVDGVASAAQQFDTTFSFGTQAAIGARGDDLSGGFLGEIDEMTIYNRALDPLEIATIYHALNGKCLAPTILLQPADQVVYPGNAAQFEVVAGGVPVLKYQWFFNGVTLDGATNATLILANADTSIAGQYAVEISNGAGSILSANAALTVLPQASCAVLPPGLVAWWRAEGNTLDSIGQNDGTLAGNAGYEAAEVGLGFSIQKPGDAVEVQNSTDLQLQNFTIEAWVRRSSPTLVNGSGGNAALFGYGSGGYVLGIEADGTLFLSQVDGRSVTSSAIVTDTQFHHVAVTKSGSVVVFFLDGVPHSAPAFAGIFQFTSAAAIGARGDNLSGNFIGDIDELSIYSRALTLFEIDSIYAIGLGGKCPPPPLITGQPQSKEVSQGSDVAFTVTVNGSRPFAYQWLFNGNPISGATNVTLTLSNVQPGQGGAYSVVIINFYGSVQSDTATLTVDPLASCVPIPSGIVGWWPGEGTTADVIGHNDGTLVDNATYGVGRVGQGFVLDGDGDGVELGAAPALQLQNLTIECWIRRSSVDEVTYAGTDAALLGYGIGGYVFGIDSGGTLFFGAVGIDSVSASSAITDTNSHHVAVTRVGSSVVFYVDGVAEPGPAYGTAFSFDTSVAIGAKGDDFTGSFEGMIDEMSVYNRALSASEIQSIFGAGSSGKCAPSAPSVLSGPVGVRVQIGCPATLTVTTAGTDPLSYQWWKDGVALSGQTNAILSIASVQAADLGSYHVIVSNSAGSVSSGEAAVAIDHLPVAVPDTLQRFAWGGVAVPAGALLANDTDADGEALHVVGVSGTSAGNGSVTLQNGWVYYLPAAGFTSADTFTYTVSDGDCGGTSTGTVSVEVKSDTNLTVSSTIESAGANQMRIRFGGAPGGMVHVQFTDSLSNPNWRDLASGTADQYGVFECTDTVPQGAGARFYRSLWTW